LQAVRYTVETHLEPRPKRRRVRQSQVCNSFSFCLSAQVPYKYVLKHLKNFKWKHSRILWTFSIVFLVKHLQFKRRRENFLRRGKDTLDIWLFGKKLFVLEQRTLWGKSLKIYLLWLLYVLQRFGLFCFFA